MPHIPINIPFKPPIYWEGIALGKSNMENLAMHRPIFYR